MVVKLARAVVVAPLDPALVLHVLGADGYDPAFLFGPAQQAVMNLGQQE